MRVFNRIFSGALMQGLRRGFTLIELMAVMAVIGILVVIARPQYLKYQARVLQSHGKLELAATYGYETAFYTSFQTFHGNLCYIGYLPEGITVTAGTATVSDDFNRFYALTSGGTTAGRANPNVPLTNHAGPPNCFGAAFSATCYPGNVPGALVCTGTIATPPNDFTSFSTVDQAFTHQIWGYVRPGRPDSWKIDQDKRLWQVRDGI
jgi:prepilin-type N-terminal cleavage/methylation domain-containing protein